MATTASPVGLILGMANISKPLNIQELLKILNARYAKDGKRMKETWARGFCRRWSHHVHMKETRLISAGRSNPSNLSNVEACQYCSVVPFISAGGDHLCLLCSGLHRWSDSPRSAISRWRSICHPLPGVLHRHAHRLHQRCHLPLMVQRFEEDFHLRYPGLRAVIY